VEVLVNRRDFFKYGAALGTVLTPACRLADAQPQTSAPAAGSAQVNGRDLALINAKIITLDARQPRAEAALIRGGRIALVGSTNDVRAAAAGARVFDAGGRTVVPGFVDAHCHMEVATSAASYMVSVHTPPLRTLTEITDALKKKAATTPRGEWVIARGSFNIQNNVPEKRLLTRQDLDAVSQDHPIIVFSGRHVAMLNTRALKDFHMWEPKAKLEAGTIVHRDESGVPTGLATEVYYHLPAYSVDQIKAAIKQHVGPMFVSKGTTTIYSIPFSANDIRADLELQQSGELPLRIRMYYHVPHTITFDGLMGSGLIPGTGSDMWRFGGMKLFIDGLGGDGRGNRLADLKWTQEELNHMVAGATSAGIQVIMHVITEEARRMGVAAVADARSRSTRPVLHRLEHGADDGPIEEIRRMRDLGIRASITPNRGRAGARGPRYRTLVSENFHPVAITDTTGTTPGSSDVMFKIACIATPTEEGGGAPTNETLPFEEALRLFTLSNARIGYEDADKGSIEAGKLGDLAVLSRDPLAGSPAQLFETKVDATILGGAVVFER
jgi:predicted amidohydrolase YtcJ